MNVLLALYQPTKTINRSYLFGYAAALLITLMAANPSYAFVLLSSSWANGEAELIVDINTTNPIGSNPPNTVVGGPSNSEFDTAYIEALNLWTNNSSFKYTANTSGAVSDPCAGSNNGVKFATTPCTGSFGATTLAVQSTFFSVPSNLNTRTITVFNNLKQWDIYTGPWTGIAEFKRVAVHELGHGLGLGHSVFGSIMYFQAGDPEVPQADDIAGASALYDTDNDGIGVASDNCPSIANPLQEDSDSDNMGDACDADIDGDGVFDSESVDVSHGTTPIGTNLLPVGPSSTNPAFSYITQSFTAGINGQLTRIDLPIFCPGGNLLLEIRTTSAMQPTSTVLTSDNFIGGIEIPTSNSGGLVAFPLATPANVISGNQYAIVLTVSGNCSWFTASAYSGGQGYISTNGSFWQSFGDFALETVVNPVPADNCPLIQNPLQEDSNNNNIGDACEPPDQDGDGIEDGSDNCPAISNPLQENFDGDSLGDACDPDDDNDTLSDDDEINIYMSNPLSEDSDSDGLSDGDEVNTYSTDLNDSDSDDDGVNDGDEVLAGTDPNIVDANVPVLGLPMMLFAGFLLLVIGIARRC